MWATIILSCQLPPSGDPTLDSNTPTSEKLRILMQIIINLTIVLQLDQSVPYLNISQSAPTLAVT